MGMITNPEPGPGHEDGADAPSGGKAKGAGAEHQAPPVMHLEAHHIKKMFKNKMPPVGTKFKVTGLAHVGAYNEDSDGPPSGGKAEGAGGEGGTKRTMALHFHKMDVAQDNQPGETTVDQDAERAKGAKAEMDKALERQEGGNGKNGTRGGQKKGNREGDPVSVPRGGETD
jgi:hypothetical protein